MATVTLAVAATLCATPSYGQPDLGPAPAVCIKGVKTSGAHRPTEDETGHSGRKIAPEMRGFYQPSASIGVAFYHLIVPGFAQPIMSDFRGTNFSTIDASDTRRRLQGLPPDISLAANLAGHFAYEPQTARMIAATQQGVFVFDPGSQDFRQIITAPDPRETNVSASDTSFRGISDIIHIARLDLTLLPTINGVFRLDGDAAVSWPGADKASVGSVSKIIDLPVHRAVLIVSGQIFWLRHDDGAIERLADMQAGLFSDADLLYGVVESPEPGHILLQGLHRDIDVGMAPGSHGFAPARVTKLAARTPQRNDIVSSKLGYLQFSMRRWFTDGGLEKLETTGLREVP